jgi:hypothetical protein
MEIFLQDIYLKVEYEFYSSALQGYSRHQSAITLNVQDGKRQPYN